jgi:hypothetical protein
VRKPGRDRERVGPLTNIFSDRDAWTVCILREGERRWGHFAFDVYGGRAPALLAAQRYRDELLRDAPPDTRVRRRKPRGTRRKPAKVGVTHETYVVQGREYERYVALWIDADGKVRRRRFSAGILRSHAEARALAEAERDEGVALARRVRRQRQRRDASRRLAGAAPTPPQLKDPLSRKGIKMPPARLIQR